MRYAISGDGVDVPILGDVSVPEIGDLVFDSMQNLPCIYLGWVSSDVASFAAFLYAEVVSRDGNVQCYSGRSSSNEQEFWSYFDFLVPMRIALNMKEYET